MRIVLIGSGNVATHLGRALYHSEYKVEQVYSRSLTNAQVLAAELECDATDDLKTILPADLYLISVKDDALPEVLQHLGSQKGVVVHTSGTLPLVAIQTASEHTAVLYPLQTFSKHKELDFLQIPLCIEASDEATFTLIAELANAISDQVVALDSEKRKALHVAAVFACNFSNHLYAIAESILKDKGMDFDLLLPLITETAHKVRSQSPVQAQTGPARRNDQHIIQEHLQFLQSQPELQGLYKVLSEQIGKKYL